MVQSMNQEKDVYRIYTKAKGRNLYTSQTIRTTYEQEIR
jgi:hypothetical protein